MIRSIVGFHRASDGDWVAELSCYHNQHIRHQPPFRPRPWVLDPAGRAARLDSPIECPLCDRAEMPDGLVVAGHAGPWDQDSVPDGLRRAHRTPSGRWGLLRVHHGTIGFQFRPEQVPPGPTVHLDVGAEQAIPPDVTHRVMVEGPARLELDFWGPPP